MKQKDKNKLGYDEDPFLPVFSLNTRKTDSYQMKNNNSRFEFIVAKRNSEDKIQKGVQRSSGSGSVNTKEKDCSYGNKKTK